MDLDNTLLREVLFWLVGGGGSAVVIYALFENFEPLATLPPKYKRYLSLAGAAVLACLCFAATVGLKYFDAPVGWQGWLESLFAVAFVAVGGSQWLHGMRQLGSD